MRRSGHGKGRRPALPQFKVMAAAVEGSGYWLGCDVLPGHRADDPLYVPLIARVRATLRQLGVLYTGDSKMAALATRADIVRHEDDYLTVLPRTGENKQVIDAGIAAVVEGDQPAMLLFEPPDRPGERPRLLGYGYERERTLVAAGDGGSAGMQERHHAGHTVAQDGPPPTALET